MGLFITVIFLHKNSLWILMCCLLGETSYSLIEYKSFFSKAIGAYSIADCPFYDLLISRKQLTKEEERL